MPSTRRACSPGHARRGDSSTSGTSSAAPVGYDRTVISQSRRLVRCPLRGTSSPRSLVQPSGCIQPPGSDGRSRLLSPSSRCLKHPSVVIGALGTRLGRRSGRPLTPSAHRSRLDAHADSLPAECGIRSRTGISSLRREDRLRQHRVNALGGVDRLRHPQAGGQRAQHVGILARELLLGH